ncbi:MAG TPA: glucokinase [Candidatus Thermoplasmatota archaeon]|nr:glucokinase [Candidatus Thermoplasmatota archaeon]
MMNEDDLDYTTQFFQKNIDVEQYDDFVLGADVGGTTTNIAVGGTKNNAIMLLFSLNFETKNLSSLLPALKQTLSFAIKQYDLHVSRGCIGAAGIVSDDHSFVDLTNISWNIDTKDLIKKTSIDALFILNDFQVLGYSLNTVDVNDETEVMSIRKTEEIKTKKPRVLLGGGTGLGKTILRYDTKNELFHAFESEGGHVDIPVHTPFELELIESIQKKKHPQYPVSYEDVLSGNGLVDIYSFLRLKKLYKKSKYTVIVDQSEDKPSLISKYRLDDEYCKETFRLYRRFFARCAKNLALESLAFSGVFIAGGIAVKNKDIFHSNEFKTEFNQSFMQSEFLKKVPLYLVSNYYLSLQGACFAAANAKVILNNQNNNQRKW